jgi:hypothetical protein
VKRVLASILSVVMMFQSFGFSMEIVSKLSDVMEHAQFHQEEYGDDLLMFLSKHYGELMTDHQKQHQDEKEEHEKLPFKQLNLAPGGLSLILFSKGFEITAPITSDLETHLFLYNSNFSSVFLDTQLRPPRLS